MGGMLVDIYTYVRQNFFLMHAYPPGRVDIGYSSEGSAEGVSIPPYGAPFFDLSGIEPYPPERVVWAEWKGRKIPLLFPDQCFAEVVSVEAGRVKIHFDIIASIFYFLSGWDELLQNSSDPLGRQLYSGSAIERLGVAGLPVVNYYYDILNFAIEQAYNTQRLPHGGGYAFTTHITHDIDKCQSGWLEGLAFHVRRMELLKGLMLPLRRLYGPDPWFNLGDVLDFDAQYQAKSTFFFLAQQGRYGAFRNADYDVGRPAYQHLLRRIAAEGHHVGVHGSFGSHASAGQLMAEAGRLNVAEYGNRFHFLMFDLLKSPHTLEEANVLFDSSLGFPDFIGFRRGTCYPFYLFDFLNNRASGVLEFPLVVMDSTLTSPRYMGLSLPEAVQAVRPVILETVKFGGFFTILWHNTMFSDVKFGGMRGVLKEILDYCKAHNAQFASLSDSWRKVSARSG